MQSMRNSYAYQTFFNYILNSDSNREDNLFSTQLFEMDSGDTKAKMNVLKRQLQEFEEFDGDKELDGLSRVIFNGVKIKEFNKIRGLINENKISQLLRGRKNIITLQKLFLGLIYEIIPITNPQRVALTNDEKKHV